MKYQILVKGKPMHPTGGSPYEFKTYQEALNTLDMCYGSNKDVKIVEVKDMENYLLKFQKRK